jgi:hypothetical protein
MIRALSMPSDYGSIAKAYVEPTKASENTLPGELPANSNIVYFRV